jgi:hypothetical protein
LSPLSFYSLRPEDQRKRDCRLSYAREYYRKNREKLREYKKSKKTLKNTGSYEKKLQYLNEYYQKNSEKLRQYRQQNSEKIREYRQTNHAKFREYRRKNSEKMREYRQKNSEKISENRQKNREKMIAYLRDYRCRKSAAQGRPSPKKYSSWKSANDLRIFFQQFSDSHLIKNWPEDWYRISLKQIEWAGGMLFLEGFCSLSLIICSTLPSSSPSIAFVPPSFNLPKKEQVLSQNTKV